MQAWVIPAKLLQIVETFAKESVRMFDKSNLERTENPDDVSRLDLFPENRQSRSLNWPPEISTFGAHFMRFKLEVLVDISTFLIDFQVDVSTF